jgi:hypothetical protein
LISTAELKEGGDKLFNFLYVPAKDPSIGVLMYKFDYIYKQYAGQSEDFQVVPQLVCQQQIPSLKFYEAFEH